MAYTPITIPIAAIHHNQRDCTYFDGRKFCEVQNISSETTAIIVLIFVCYFIGFMYLCSKAIDEEIGWFWAFAWFLAPIVIHPLLVILF